MRDAACVMRMIRKSYTYVLYIPHSIKRESERIAVTTAPHQVNGVPRNYYAYKMPFLMTFGLALRYIDASFGLFR